MEDPAGIWDLLDPWAVGQQGEGRESQLGDLAAVVWGVGRAQCWWSWPIGPQDSEGPEVGWVGVMAGDRSQEAPVYSAQSLESQPGKYPVNSKWEKTHEP